MSLVYLVYIRACYLPCTVTTGILLLQSLEIKFENYQNNNNNNPQMALLGLNLMVKDVFPLELWSPVGRDPSWTGRTVKSFETVTFQIRFYSEAPVSWSSCWSSGRGDREWACVCRERRGRGSAVWPPPGRGADRTTEWALFLVPLKILCTGGFFSSGSFALTRLHKVLPGFKTLERTVS